MSTKVTLHVSDQDIDYAHDAWYAAEHVLYAVNKILAEKGIDITFNVMDHGDPEAVPDEFIGSTKWIEVKEE